MAIDIGFLLELIYQGQITFKYGGRRISIIEADRLSKVVSDPFCIKLFQMFNRKLFFRFGSEQRLDMHIKANHYSRYRESGIIIEHL